MMNSIRIAVAQMNPTVGDYRGNAAKILQWIQAADRRRADLIVFPELALSGYPVWDLAHKKRFVGEGLRVLERIVKGTRGRKIAVVLGFIDVGNNPRLRSHNALAWISRGRLVAKYYKRLLPTYDVFLEEIYFEPGGRGCVVPWKGGRVGPAICEDLWDDHYTIKPLRDLARAHADFVVSISASPFHRTVAAKRDALVKRHAVRYGLPILYVNQVGGQDDLIFDGRSFLVDRRGRVIFRAPAFKEGLFYFDWNPRQDHPQLEPVETGPAGPGEVYQALVTGIRDYCRKNGFRKVLVGLSGGIDSALVAALAVDALGPRAVLGVSMPSEFSSRASWEDASELSERLGISLRRLPIQKAYRLLLKEYHGRVPRKRKGRASRVTLAMENLQARLRGLALMYLSNDEDRLLLSTGNKSELAMGYCTLYGDMAGGLAVLGDVYKTDVYRLAWYRNLLGEVIPDNILRKAPSAELRPNQTDEDSLPRYEVLDEILYLLIEKNQSREEVLAALRAKRVPAETVIEVLRKLDHNEYKRRQTPPILRVTEKAWFGRRMPITNRFDL